MNMKIEWTGKSYSDLRTISEFISKDNRVAAKQTLQLIRRKARQLAEHPFLGRRTEFGEIRELVVHENYILYYRVSQRSVEILRVWHAAQNRYH
jgi:toxin ParE1/3/4